MKNVSIFVRHRAPVRLCTSVLAVACVFSVHAQPQLTETVVTATRTVQALSDLVADISIVDRAMIERSGASGVADVLARLPGVEIARNGGVGGITSVFLRGGNSQHTAVYLDGVRLDAQSGSGGVAWEAIPLAQIDRIEVLRGPAAAVYGSDAIHGVIQLFTRRGEGPAAPYVGLGLGSHGLRSTEAGVSGRTGVDGALDYSLGLSDQRSDGFDTQPLRLRLGTDGVRNTDQDGFRSQSANARVGFKVNRVHRLDATLLSSKTESQYDSSTHKPASPVDDRSFHDLRSLGLNWESQWTEVYSTRLSVTDSRSRYETRPAVYMTTTDLRGYLLQNELRFGPHLVTATLERREDVLENSAVGPNRNRTQNGVALGYGFVQAGHTVQLNARHDNDSGFGGKSTGGAAYGYALTPQWRATASAGTAFRAPTLYQRFSEFGVSSLQPETSRNLEAGLRYTEGANSVGAVVYRNRVSHLVTYVNGAGACVSTRGCYESVDRAGYEGLTLSGNHQWGTVNLSASADFQNPQNLGTGKQLPRRARRHATFGADTQVAGWRLGAELQASDRRFDTAANTTQLAGYVLLNLSASTRLTRDFTLLARIDNLTDQDYQTARLYATEGRTFYVGLKWAPL